MQTLQDIFYRHLQDRNREHVSTAISCNIALSERRQFEIKLTGAWLVSQISYGRTVLLHWHVSLSWISTNVHKLSS